jgi:AraC-like DNA-binding protein
MRLATMRLLSPDLQPAELALPIIPPRNQIPDELSGIPVTVSGKHFGMAFKLADILSRPFPLAKPYKEHPHRQADPIGTDQLGSIAGCISGFLASSAPNRLSERVAKAFGMSARTYRRHLAEMGTTHALLLADVRLDMALGLLADDGNSVTGIAMELGYAHPGDFTRFFKARMGVSPAEFRRLRCGTELGPC